MITLVLIVCLASTPTVCHEERPPVDVASPMACMVQGEQIAAEWVDEHPKWTLVGWTCHVGPREKQI